MNNKIYDLNNEMTALIREANLRKDELTQKVDNLIEKHNRSFSYSEKSDIKKLIIRDLLLGETYKNINKWIKNMEIEIIRETKI